MAQPGSQDGVAIAACCARQDWVEEHGGKFHESSFLDTRTGHALLQFSIDPVCGMSDAFDCRVNVKFTCDGKRAARSAELLPASGATVS